MSDSDKDIAQTKRDLFRHLHRNIRSQSVLSAMERVPREHFVPPEARHMAYLNIPLGIGEGQTISQPYIVALMTEALGLQGYERVLEVGTGSGYQAAVLSRLVPEGRVITVERVPSLAESARKALQELGYDNVTVELAGPTLGAPHHAPFDAIIVTAASPQVPDSLVSQLAVGGRLVIPVGSRDNQDLMKVIRTDEGISVRWLGPCRFVPLIGRDAFPG
ncbi:MAG TPA: protein-L-isoaspartate(D-aspartate) O-methyltransferase [Dehalococcoidia bacterium]|nr:protein-L-isoaspartate(D-aspartate) O-methyltransferase [Dehalococcoidia bacterium]